VKLDVDLRHGRLMEKQQGIAEDMYVVSGKSRVEKRSTSTKECKQANQETLYIPNNLFRSLLNDEPLTKD
jgi:hypothetical protein